MYFSRKEVENFCRFCTAEETVFDSGENEDGFSPLVNKYLIFGQKFNVHGPISDTWFEKAPFENLEKAKEELPEDYKDFGAEDGTRYFIVNFSDLYFDPTKKEYFLSSFYINTDVDVEKGWITKEEKEDEERALVILLESSRQETTKELPYFLTGKERKNNELSFNFILKINNMIEYRENMGDIPKRVVSRVEIDTPFKEWVNNVPEDFKRNKGRNEYNMFWQEILRVRATA